MKNTVITLTKAISTLNREYKRAIALPHIAKPVSYALYMTWKKIDSEEIGRLPVLSKGERSHYEENR